MSEWDHEVERRAAEFLAGETELEAANIVALANAEAARVAAESSKPTPEPSPIVRRSDYVPEQLESHYCVRDAAGLPVVRLVYSGNFLAIRSDADDGVIIRAFRGTQVE